MLCRMVLTQLRLCRLHKASALTYLLTDRRIIGLGGLDLPFRRTRTGTFICPGGQPYTIYEGKLFDRSSQFSTRTTCVLLCERTVHTSAIRSFWDGKEDKEEEKRIVKKTHEFAKHEIRNRTTFLAIVMTFKKQDGHRRGQIEFILAALRSMKDYGVERDLECYKQLLDVFPKKVMVPENYLQADMWHFGRHQQCAIDLLSEMEENGVCPDKEMYEIMVGTFGQYTHASRKFGRMMYWIPKFKNLSPFPLPETLPNDVLELAILAIKRITVDLQAEIQQFETEKLDFSLDKTWIVSSQSPKQKELIEEHNKDQPLYVEGPFTVWLRRVSISYFILRADAKIFPEVEEDTDDVSKLVLDAFNPLKGNEVIKKPSVHEQEDGVIMALCATGTSSRDSVLSWVRFLERDNLVLKDLSVLFTLRAPSKELVTINDKRETNEETTGELPPS